MGVTPAQAHLEAGWLGDSPLTLSPWERDAVTRSVRKFRSGTVDAASLLHPHPPADADMLRCKLAKASLRGEGQDEGRVP